MGHVPVLKAAHHLHDGVAFADMAQKLIAQTLPAARPPDQPGDIHEFHRGGRIFFGVVHLRQDVQPAVGDRDDADIGLDGAERVIGGRHPRAGDGVKKRALAHIRQAYDAKFHDVPRLEGRRPNRYL